MKREQEINHWIPEVPVALGASGVEVKPGRLIRAREGEG